jgi:ribosomal protein S18 acetylase RimI-like enzyme
MIRDLAISDIENITIIYIESSISAYSSVIDKKLLEKHLQFESIFKYFTNNLTMKGEKIFVYEQDGNIAGFMELLKNGKLLEIKKIYVSSKYYRHGIGSNLIEYAQKISYLENIQLISLWVLEKNMIGRRFYEKRGFFTTGIVKNLERYNSNQVEYRKLLKDRS